MSIFPIITNNNIIIPLNYINNTEKISNYIEFLFLPQLYAKIKLGIPEQTIYLLISTNTEYFSIESNNINPKFYNSNISSSSIKTDIKFSYYKERYKYGSSCIEQFYFLNNLNTLQEIPYKNISFDYIYALSDEYKEKEQKYYIDKDNNELSGIIGLQLPKSFTYSNFIKRLSNAGIISKNIWSIFSFNSKQYLILGEDPYKINHLEAKRTNSYSSEYYHYWYFLFSDIRTGHTKLNEQRIAEYSPQFGGIIGTKEYKNYIKNNFFNDLINNKQCLEKNITLNNKIYSYYECDVNIEINNFEPLEFIHQELSYNFILDKNDLFKDFIDKKYFLCVFLEEDLEHSYLTKKNWILGTPFVKKFNFVFDQDSKLILFYENQDKNIESNLNTFQEKNYFYMGIIIFVSVFMGIILIYLYVV